MKYSKNLELFEWSLEARKMLDYLSKNHVASPPMLFIRHSARLESKVWQEIIKLRLTDEGKQAAFDYGSRLPHVYSYRIHHSPIMRCQETAEEIRAGLISRKQEILDLAPLKELGEIIGDNNEMGKLFEHEPRSFVHRWAAGHFPEHIVEPFIPYVKKTARTVLKIHQKQNSTNNICDIFVGHDISLMAYEFGWLGKLRDTSSSWLNFLGGFSLIINQGFITAFTQEKEIRVPAPHWFESALAHPSDQS